MSDIPESARLNDEQINTHFRGLQFTRSDIWKAIRAAEEHTWNSRDAEVAELQEQVQFMTDQFQSSASSDKAGAEMVAELKGKLFAAEELSEMWHVEAIAVKRAGKAQVARLVEAVDTIRVHGITRKDILPVLDAAIAATETP